MRQPAAEGSRLCRPPSQAPSIFAAGMKSLSVSPSILCVHSAGGRTYASDLNLFKRAFAYFSSSRPRAQSLNG